MHITTDPTDTAVSGIYLIWLSETRYYGGRSKNIYNRCRDHLKNLRQGKHDNPIMQKVFNKHQIFGVEVLSEISDSEERIRAEQAWLDENVGRPGCVNVSPSAQVPSWKGKKHKLVTLKKISESSRGRIRTEESKQRQSAAMAGKGHSQSEATREKIAASKRGAKRRSFSAEHLLKLSESQRIRHARNGGQSDVQKQATANANRKRVFNEESRTLWVRRDGVTRRVNSEEVTSLLKDGWERGRGPRVISAERG